MDLTLTPQEAKLVSNLLARAQTDLLREINHTDRLAFREALTADEALLEGILARLQPAVSA